MRAFYMNYMENGGAPTAKYDTKEEAENEAARLVIVHQRRVFTLMATSCSEPPPKVIKQELDAPYEIPF